MKLACDNQVGLKTVQWLEKIGHEVVVWAGDLPDNEWFEEALDYNAEVFISPDWDIVFLCNKHNKRNIQIPPNLKKQDIFNFLKKRLNHLEKKIR